MAHLLRCEDIVRMDSAGGSACEGRDPQHQAVMRLRGKILNTENKSVDKILHNEEIKGLVAAIGGGIGKDFDVSKIRYDKIIIMTDADLDGGHIRCLCLVFFWKHMKELVKQGHVYIANPPLYRIKRGDKLVCFIRNEKELAKWMDSEIRKNYEVPKNWKFDPNNSEHADMALNGRSIQRIKGLGEMNPEDLYETTMKVGSRTLTKVEIDPEWTDEDIDNNFKLLLGGDQSVEERKNFIKEQALNAEIDG